MKHWAKGDELRVLLEPGGGGSRLPKASENLSVGNSLLSWRVKSTLAKGLVSEIIPYLVFLPFQPKNVLPGVKPLDGLFYTEV